MVVIGGYLERGLQLVVGADAPDRGHAIRTQSLCHPALWGRAVGGLHLDVIGWTSVSGCTQASAVIARPAQARQAFAADRLREGGNRVQMNEGDAT